jgi:hypothetical protein
MSKIPTIEQVLPHIARGWKGFVIAEDEDLRFCVSAILQAVRKAAGEPETENSPESYFERERRTR